jgi:fatty acyl-CoA reductase
VEKILRVQPDVRRLYLLVNAEDANAAKRRTDEEIVGSSLFECLQALHGEEFEAFASEKVSTVLGNMSQEFLGMDPSMYAALAEELDIIVNSAGTTTFDERWGYCDSFFSRFLYTRHLP